MSCDIVADKLVCMTKEGHAVVAYLLRFEECDDGYSYAFSPSRSRAVRLHINKALVVKAFLDKKAKDGIAFGIVPA